MEYKESVSWNTKLYEKCPKYPGVTNNLAIAYENLNMHVEAEKYYKEAENLCNSNTIILNNISLLYESTDENEKALEYYKKSLEFNSRSS